MHTALWASISSLSTSCGKATAADKPTSLTPLATALQMLAESAVVTTICTPGLDRRNSSSARGTALFARPGDTEGRSPSTALRGIQHGSHLLAGQAHHLAQAS